MKPLWNFRRRGRKSQATVSNDVTLSDVLTRYDVVEVVPGGEGHEPFVLVTDRAAEPSKELAETSNISFAEIGTSSPSPFTSFVRQEYNAKLRGLRGLEVYDQMRRSDGTVRGTLRLIKTPVLGARWFVEPASDSERDKAVADFVHKCLTEYMSISFPQLLTEALLMCDFGYYMFEKVWEPRIIDGQPRIVWKKLAPRHPMDVKQWHLDSGGGPRAVSMYAPHDFVPNIYGGPQSLTDDIVIPINKLLVFTFDKEADNIQGISVLRSAYKHWYFKDQLYKIDAIQKERHGIGIPVIKLPVGFKREDRVAAEDLGRNLRTNERAHVVLPPNWDLIFAKVEGNPVDAMKSIEHHDARIRENILATFLSEHRGGVRTEDQALFLKATRFIADVVCDTFNHYAIPQLVDFNFSRGLSGYPKLRARRIGESEDQRTLSFTIRNMVGAGVIEPDDVLEAFVRKELDLPLKDFDTARQIVIDHNDDVEEEENQERPEQNPRQRGQRVGLPRQQSRPPVGPPRSNAGVDRSGGQ